MPHYERRNNHTVYGGPMTGTPAVPSRTTFIDWLNAIFEEFKNERRWSIRHTVATSRVPRSTIYRWLDGATPERDLVLKFCENLDLDIAEPFALLGWDPAGPSASPTRDPEPLVQDPRIRKFQALLRDPDLLPDERAKYEGFLDMVIADVEASLEQRRQHGDS